MFKWSIGLRVKSIIKQLINISHITPESTDELIAELIAELLLDIIHDLL
jgi:hypothetical protein